jgi:hypothetical protein
LPRYEEPGEEAWPVFRKYLLLLKSPRAITAKTMTMSEIGNGNSLEMINAIPK